MTNEIDKPLTTLTKKKKAQIIKIKNKIEFISTIERVNRNSVCKFDNFYKIENSQKTEYHISH